MVTFSPCLTGQSGGKKGAECEGVIESVPLAFMLTNAARSGSQIGLDTQIN
jgi:hypothetical protein